LSRPNWKTRVSVASVLIGGLAVLSPALAQGPALSLLPRDHAVRSGPLFSVGIRAHVPVPIPRPFLPSVKAAEPATDDEDTAETPATPPAPASKAQSSGLPRLVKVPLPPIPDRPRAKAVAAAQPGSEAAPALQATQVTALAPIPAPARRATGIFSLFEQAEPTDDNHAGSGDSALIRPTGASLAPAAPLLQSPVPVPRAGVKVIARLDLEDPFRQRKKTPATLKDEQEDDDDYESGSVEKQVASVQISCLKPQLMALIHKAGDHFGATPVITSGYRDHGRRGSLHRSCEAADFIVPGVGGGELVAFLRKQPGAGGVGTYCHTKSVHIDIGEPRDWRYCGRGRSYFALRAPVIETARK